MYLTQTNTRGDQKVRGKSVLIKNIWGGIVSDKRSEITYTVIP